MPPDIKTTPWGNQPRNTFNSCSPDHDEHSCFNPTSSPSRDNQRDTDMNNIEITEEMTSFFRNIVHKHCDERAHPEYHRSVEQKQHSKNTDDGVDSGTDTDSYHLEGNAILPELVKLTLAQHRMILSLRDVNKEAGVQLRITNARLDLVEEELGLMRSSLAEHATPSLFSGVPVRMSNSFGGTERDTTSDYVPTFDLTDIGATLAAGPSLGSDLGHQRRLTRDGSPSPRSSNQQRRSPRTEREEHIKRTRISYDGLGGQDPKIPPSTHMFCSTSTPQSWTLVTNDTSESEGLELDFQSESSMDDKPNCDDPPQPSLLRKLLGKMARLLLGM